MTTRQKPFPYDVIETHDAVIFIIDHKSSDIQPGKGVELTPKGVEIKRADDSSLRVIHLHPRLIRTIPRKQCHIIETAGEAPITYPASNDCSAIDCLSSVIDGSFYWYFGPETASPRDIVSRPFAHLLDNVTSQTVAVAPGEDLAGPLIGLCYTSRMLPLARGRSWIRPTSHLIVDAKLIAGTTTGYPANDNISECVELAHKDAAYPLKDRSRASWSSQLAMIHREQK